MFSTINLIENSLSCFEGLSLSISLTDQCLRRLSPPQDARQGFKVHSEGKNGYLELTDIGCKIQMRGSARSWGNPTTCTILYRNSKWYASITVKCEPKRETGNSAIGLDFGCKTAIADSTGNKIEPPKFLKGASTQINKISKQLRRKRKPEKKKVKASRRWKKTLNDRLHICSNPKCGHTEDRDINSAQVCLTWARGSERASLDGDDSSSTASPKVKYCGGFQQLAQTKRQKLMAQRSEAE